MACRLCASVSRDGASGRIEKILKQHLTMSRTLPFQPLEIHRIQEDLYGTFQVEKEHVPIPLKTVINPHVIMKKILYTHVWVIYSSGTVEIESEQPVARHISPKLPQGTFTSVITPEQT